MHADWLTAAHNWLDEARLLALRHFRTGLAITDKEDASPVTIADQQIEALLRERIRTEFGDHGIIGEEAARENEDADCQWVVDPIDGTRSFITGNPLFGTLLGLLVEGQFELGLMDLPVTRERWWAVRGDGAFFQGRRCTTSGLTDLSLARLACTSPQIFSAEEWPRFDHLAQQVRVVRYGGDCFNYGALACGWVDLVAEASLQFYDVAALVVLIEEAGGVITDWNGQPLRLGWDGTCLAAATPELHADALNAVS